MKLIVKGKNVVTQQTFSILERIDVGETFSTTFPYANGCALSVSSNGSTWVKLVSDDKQFELVVAFSILERIDVGETPAPGAGRCGSCATFQYPRTDRRG